MKEIPLPIVGGTAFGRYPKISTEETFNMMISDGALVPFPGYFRLANAPSSGVGRGIYVSSKYNRLIAVVGDTVYSVSPQNGISALGAMLSSTGDAFISENDNDQISITDGQNIYVYNYSANTFTTVTGAALGFIPSYITFIDGYSICPSGGTNQFRLSTLNTATSFPFDSQHVGAFESDADIVIVTVAFNRQIFIFGENLIEIWYDEGLQLFPLQRNNYYVIPYGTISPNSIAHNNDMIVWLAQNKISGLSIMYSKGGNPEQISNDGINFRLSRLTNPKNTYGYICKIDGHVMYILTAPDDNFTYMYDFNTSKFFTLTDPYGDYHIAKKVARFNNKTYFISFNDPGIYEMSTDYFTFNGAEIPRTRICPPLRLPNSLPFETDEVIVTMEQGDISEIRRVDISLSKDGGVSYGESLGEELQLLPNRQNLFRFYNLGYSNDLRTKFRFWGSHKFVVIGATAGVRL